MTLLTVWAIVFIAGIYKREPHSPDINGLREKCIPNKMAKCTREYMPVCADGITYSNICLANAACHNSPIPGRCVNGDS